MAVSPDVVASALNELMPSYSELFVKYHPLLEKVLKGGNMDRAALKGPKREFAVVTAGPGTVTEIATGSEVIAGGRSQNAHRGTVIAPRLIYAFDVPGKDLAEANGEMDLARILQHYPELALDDFHTRISNQIGTGNGSGVGGFMTLNGTTATAAFNPQGETRRGILQDISPALQAQTIHNITQADVSGWSNQFQDVTDPGANGRAQMRKAYYAASRQGKTLGPVDLMLGDEASYLNYIDDLDDAVRVAKIEGDKSPANVRQGVKFLDADFFLDDSIDVTATDAAAANYFSAQAQDGIIYGLKTPTWYQFTLGHDAAIETKGDFAVRGPFRIPDQDVYRYELVLMMGMHTTQLRANFVVTGMGTPS
tara:strand:- start:5483 stop:6580 length:1098 start_codon:yes stop_codon:yes gene_type:complete